MIPTSEEIVARTYFLQEINTPFGVWAVRLCLIALLIILIAMYGYAIRKNKEADSRSKE